MRPINLKMKAFLAYKDEVEIDFSVLNEGLYLISGPTGSGKTTIFDAICFALYGTSSGNRKPVNLRSDFASDKTETSVEYTFELKKRIYTIKRTPAYKRAGYKTMKQPTALLTMDDSTIIEGVKEVNNKVIEILGITLEQFKQIVMISQGEFTRLIYADSEEREKVLRRIFNTYRMLDIEENLKEKVRTYKEEYNSSNHLLNSSLELLIDLDYKEFTPDILPSIDNHNKEVKVQLDKTTIEKEKQEKIYDEHIKDYQIKQLHNQKVESYNQIQQNYHELLKNKALMNQLNDEIKIINDIYNHIDLIKDYQVISKQLDDNKKAYDKKLIEQKKTNEKYDNQIIKYQTLDEKRQNQKSLNIKISKIKEMIEEKKEYEKDLKEYNEKNEKLKEIEKLYSTQEKKKDKLKDRIERDSENVGQLTELSIQLKDMDIEANKVKERRASIHELSDLYDQYTDMQDTHYTLSMQYNKLSDKYRLTYEQYQHEDEKYKRQQAGILALELEDNKPCPVCGSLHHPHIALIEEEVLSVSELDRLASKLKQTLEQRDESYNTLLEHNQQLTAIKTRIQSIKDELDIKDELSKEIFIRLLSNIMIISKKQKKTYNKLSDEIKYLERLSKSVKQAQIDLKEQEEELDKLSKQISKGKEEVSKLAGKIQTYQKDNYQDIEEQYNQSCLALETLTKEIRKIEKDYEKMNKQKTKVDTEVKNIEEIIEKDTIQYNELKNNYTSYIHDTYVSEAEFMKYYDMLSLKEQKEKVYSKYIINVEKAKSSLENIEKELDNKEIYNLAELNKQIQEMKIKKDIVIKEYQYLQSKLDNNEKIYKRLDKEYHRNEKLLKQYQNYLHLSDITSGKNSMRMSFERYVLSFYFENILDYANIELSLMTNGRYKFVRKTDVKGNSKQGLDLDIMDYETGMVRAVQTLSGGESFKAALSLALGLSSMIQSYVGGIELNALFIDEGFGTLDDESLNQAIHVLMSLEVHHKTIGIISHVNELKEKIDQQIIIVKDNQGSHVVVNFHK